MGKYCITKGDVILFKRINALQPGTDTSINAILLNMKKTFYCLHLADSLGVPITDSVLLWEKNRIDKNTHMPQRIDSIKKACADSLTYLRLFVLPQLAKRWLHYYYYQLDNLHRSVLDSARIILTHCLKKAQNMDVFKALSGVALDQTAKEFHMSCHRYKVSEEHGFVLLNNTSPVRADSLHASPSESRSSFYSFYVMDQIEAQSIHTAKAFIHEILNKIQVGAIYPYPIDMQHTFWIVQYIDFFEKEHYIVVISIPKKDFFLWFHEQTGL